MHVVKYCVKLVNTSCSLSQNKQDCFTAGLTFVWAVRTTRKIVLKMAYDGRSE